ncbi:F0F1 ATP synthase subunit B [Sphingosinicella sp. LY1275]|uniref:F0F1 ATP synthase subunit B family protein n=1 Tax=Sphingosinicella sp. LY1275 TaxID=3095379 RepID=UPI002ADEBF17|nr:F0F1 ATP synthase subunit B [Sphingosinicella sp. LY1275]MEA1013758.1 F0F1 ATP synthase subunit B [Sphingosinicella sp. LY1275]
MANTNIDPQSAEVAANLAAASTEGEQGAVPHTGADAVATTAAEGHGDAALHAEPKALGMDATMWVALAMVLVILIMLWKKVPAAIGRSLDKKIAGVREQLDEAAKLRAEAEALKAEYEAKAAQAGAEAQTMIDRARHEADAIVQQAKADSAALVERRTRMAEDKIGAAERAAVQEIRAKAATAAAAAAATLIAQQHDASADKAMVDQTIAGLGRTH